MSLASVLDPPVQTFSNEPNPERLWRVLLGTVMVLWFDRAPVTRTTFYFDLKETFGNEYRPREGLYLSIGRGEKKLKQKIVWSMVWTHLNTLNMRVEFDQELVELCKAGPLEELEVELRNGPSRRTFKVTHAQEELSH